MTNQKSELEKLTKDQQLMDKTIKKLMQMHTRQEVLKNGKYLSTSYGISKLFEWKLYTYKNTRYNISMFDNTIEEVKRQYCNDCGRASYSIKVGICNKCHKEQK